MASWRLVSINMILISLHGFCRELLWCTGLFLVSAIFVCNPVRRKRSILHTRTCNLHFAGRRTGLHARVCCAYSSFFPCWKSGPYREVYGSILSIKLIRSCTTFIFTRNLQKFAITRSEDTQCVPLAIWATEAITKWVAHRVDLHTVQRASTRTSRTITNLSGNVVAARQQLAEN